MNLDKILEYAVVLGPFAIFFIILNLMVPSNNEEEKK